MINLSGYDVDWAESIQTRLPRPFRRWWSRLSLSTQLSGLILLSGLAMAMLTEWLLGTAPGASHVVMRWGVVLVAVLSVVLVATRLVGRTIERMVTGAQALVRGEYDDVRLLRRSGASAEVRELEDAFDALAVAIVEREHILQSEMLQLREIEHLKNEFVSTVSHELRTPLTSVRGALGLVLGGPLAAEMPQKARELLRIALQNSERLIRLINDILDVEKMEAGEMTLREERCDMGSILRTTVAGVQSLAHDAGVKLVIEGDATADVTGDPDRLVQVFTNLVSNAIKVSPRGEVVGVGLSVQGTTATVSVSDRGAGIPAEFQDRIFGKFQQADASALRRPGGTGLGLAIARAITEMHDGTIRFDTTVGAGTTFSVALPCVAAAHVSMERDQSNRPRILIVVQDYSMRSILETLCAPLGDVITAPDTGDLLSAARMRAFDAILLDPDANGADTFGTIRRMRELDGFASVPVLVFSSQEYSAEELSGVTLAQSHAFVKSRDRETDVLLRLRAVLAVRRTRNILVAA